MSKRNYARHIETGRMVFFNADPPMPETEYPEWAFHHVPDIEDPVAFRGSIVGECSYQMCERKQHAPRACQSCLGRYHYKLKEKSL